MSLFRRTPFQILDLAPNVEIIFTCGIKFFSIPKTNKEKKTSFIFSVDFLVCDRVIAYFCVFWKNVGD